MDDIKIDRWTLYRYWNDAEFHATVHLVGRLLTWAFSPGGSRKEVWWSAVGRSRLGLASSPPQALTMEWIEQLYNVER